MDAYALQQKRRSGEADAALLKPLPSRVNDSDDADERFLFVLDVEENKGGNGFFLWCVTNDWTSVLLRCTDFAQRFFVTPPMRTAGADGSKGEEGLSDEDLAFLRTAIAARCAKDVGLQSVSMVSRLPLNYYRPSGARPLLCLTASPGTPLSKLLAAVTAVKASDALAERGLSWRSLESYEDQIKPLHSFLVHSGVSGGAWIRVSGATAATRASRISSCALELDVSYRNLHSLSPDAAALLADEAALAAQLASPRCPPAAGAGLLPPLRLLLLHVIVVAAASAAPSTETPAASGLQPKKAAAGSGGGGVKKGAAKGKAAATSQPAAPVAPVDANRTPSAAHGDPIKLIACAVTAVPQGGARLGRASHVVFGWGCSAPAGRDDDDDETIVVDGDDDDVVGGGGGGDNGEPRMAAPPGVDARAFASERDMLRAFFAFFVSKDECDPDVVGVYKAQEAFGALLERAKALGACKPLAACLSHDPLLTSRAPHRSPSHPQACRRPRSAARRRALWC